MAMFRVYIRVSVIYRVIQNFASLYPARSTYYKRRKFVDFESKGTTRTVFMHCFVKHILRKTPKHGGVGVGVLQSLQAPGSPSLGSFHFLGVFSIVRDIFR